MPRITYADRFDTLLAKEYLSERDRTFAESLYGSYKHRRTLTAGRKRCLLDLEARYDTRPQCDEEMIARITDLRTRMSGDDAEWGLGFTDSLLKQLRSGSALSERQQEVLAKIESQWTGAELNKRLRWEKDFTPEMRQKFDVMVEYYRKNGYFQQIVARSVRNPEAVPSKGDYERVTVNKYAEKVIDGYFAAPKYPAGTLVALRAMANWDLRRKLPSGLAIVITENAQVPVAAARGNKVYKLLPVGGTQTVFAEERELKTHRLPKKKTGKKTTMKA